MVFSIWYDQSRWVNLFTLLYHVKSHNTAVHEMSYVHRADNNYSIVAGAEDFINTAMFRHDKWDFFLHLYSRHFNTTYAFSPGYQMSDLCAEHVPGLSEGCRISTGSESLNSHTL